MCNFLVFLSLLFFTAIADGKIVNPDVKARPNEAQQPGGNFGNLAENPPASSTLSSTESSKQDVLQARLQELESESITIAGSYMRQKHFLLPIPCREFFPHLWNARGLLGAGVEVGVLRGDFARHIMSIWEGEMMYLIDAWAEQDQETYVDINNVNPQLQRSNLDMAIAAMKPYENRTKFIASYSTDAASIFSSDFFDWVYLDADHSFSAVRADLTAWYPKVKPGGILAGHDYIPDGRYNAGEFGVAMAVLDFAQRHSLQVITTYSDAKQLFNCFESKPNVFSEGYCTTGSPSWYILKPWDSAPGT
jgi:hypothetical protein